MLRLSEFMMVLIKIPTASKIILESKTIQVLLYMRVQYSYLSIIACTHNHSV